MLFKYRSGGKSAKFFLAVGPQLNYLMSATQTFDKNVLAYDTLVTNLTAMMEPMIMMFLGVILGGLVIAMYLPIFKLGSVVG